MSVPIGVIFDMDGVLVDSYWAHYASWQQMVAEHGRTMSKRQFDITFGRTSREIIAQLWPEVGDEKAILALDRRKEWLFRQALATRFPPMSGAGRLLRRLFEAGIPMAIGSSAPVENVDLTLDRLRARPWMAAVVHGGHVTRGKPDPQVFLLAAMRLGVPPHRCVVVEDAPLGIEGAHRAGMAAVGMASTGRTTQMLHHAESVVTSLDQLSPTSFRRLVDASR